jgi:hypothetical protein
MQDDRVTVEIPSGVHRLVKIEAAQRGLRVNAMMRIVVTEWLKAHGIEPLDAAVQAMERR